MNPFGTPIKYLKDLKVPWRCPKCETENIFRGELYVYGIKKLTCDGCKKEFELSLRFKEDESGIEEIKLNPKGR